MVTQVSFGNFSTINGKNVLTGVGGSGIDTQTLIASLAATRGAQATQDQTQITANNSQMTALNQFQQLVSNFQSAADALRNPPGVDNAANNVFQFTTGNVSTNGSGYLTVDTSPGAALQSYTINNITQLASTATQSSGIFTLSSANSSAVSANPIVGTNYQFGAGTFTLNGQSITFNEGDSLNTVAAKFNAVSSSTGVNATVIQISSNQFELQFNAVNTGAANSFDLSSPSSVTDASGVLNNIGLTKQQDSGAFAVANTAASVVSANPIVGTNYQFAPGTITFAGSGATVTLHEGDSLATVASDFNAVSNQTGIMAHIIEPSAGNFKLAFTATTGSGNFDLSKTATVSNSGGAINNIGLTEQQSTGTLTVANINTSPIVSASPIGGTANQFAPGTLTFAGSGATVTLSEGDSLTTVASTFNAVSSQTGITANIIEPTAGNYKLVFTATTSAGTFNITNPAQVSDPSSVLPGASIGAAQTAPSETAGNAATAGTDAQFKINGLSIDRSSNNINDVINGVTFNLQQVTSSDPSSNADIIVSVNPDTTTVQNAIVNFVNSYNAIKTFAAQQTQLNADGTYASTAILAGNSTFRSTMADLNQQVTTQVAGLSGSLTSLASVGITLTTQPATSGTNATPQVDNILTVNDGELSSALSTNFQGVSNLFGFNLTSNNSDLGIFAESTPLGANSFTLNINPGTSTFTADIGGGNPLINLTATAIANGYLLSGPAGSALAGLQLIYASTSPATISVTATQGIADQMYNTSNTATTTNTGTLAVALNTLQTDNTNLNTDITRVNQQVALYQTQLLQQFSALEQTVSNVNNLLDALSSNDSARFENAQTS